MKIIKVKYIPMDSSEEKTIELLNVNHITENLLNETLSIEINDTSKRNNNEMFVSMLKSKIIAIIIEESDGTRLNEITDYVKIRNINRSIYNVINDEDSNTENDNVLRLTFAKSISN